MREFCLATRLAVMLSALGLLTAAAHVEAIDSATVKRSFSDPSRHYSTGPLWTWNDMLTEDHIRLTLRDLAEQKVRQVWVHPRPGLMTPYLSADWFRLWRVALDEANRLDMNVWIYDENSYPSGFAGGLVPEAMPESRGRGLAFREEKRPGKPGEDVLAVFRLTDDGYENVTDQARSANPLAEARYLVAYVDRADNLPWFGGKCYVDLLYPGVTEKFIETTFEAYRRHFGDEFGKHIPGIFTDEPQIRPAGMPWTDHLPQEFQKRWGYSLTDHLPCLSMPIGQWRRVRHNYLQVLLEQFVEHWGKPCYDYCQKHGLEFTGHYWDHSWPNCIGVPDNMAMYAWQQRPGIDILFNQYQEGVHAQFGNARVCVELGSVANQLGRSRTISETFGGSGWDMRFEDIKRQGDWEYALGVNTLNECISFISIRGVRKGDYPQSLSYHEPWWEAYHVLAGYFTRLSVALSHGQQINPTLVIEPTTTAWMYQNHKQLGPIGDRFQQMVTSLSKAQVEYDIGSEYIMAEHGSVDGPTLVVGQRKYSTVVLPPLTESLNAQTMDLLEAYIREGGIVLCCGQPPSFVDAQPSDRGRAASQGQTWKQVEPEALPGVLLERSTDGFAVHRNVNDQGILYHHRRQLDDGDLLFLVNTSIRSRSCGTLHSAAKGVERWILETGDVSPYPFQADGGGVEARFELPPCGSLLLFLSDQPRRPAPAETAEWQTVRPAGALSFHRVGPNVLTLDYVDVTAGGETKESVHCRVASHFVFAAHGMDRNPWFHAIQFRDEHIRKTFASDSGFEASYRFAIEQRVPESLIVVIERPDLYTITCNGKPASAIGDAWWLDRCFGKIDIGSVATVGENVVNIQASPFTMYHELEPVYVLGDFSLKPARSGFVIVPEVPLELGRRSTRHTTSPNGNMWLSGGIGFRPGAGGDRKDDGDPFLVFDLGSPNDLRAIKVWNYNEVSWTRLGVKQVEISASKSGQPDSFTSLGKYELIEAPGSPTSTSDQCFPQAIRVRGQGVRFVKFDILSNHNDVTYPTDDASRYHAFVGLSEVQFFASSDGEAGSAAISGVTVAGMSAELSIPGVCDRRAEFLVNGSGLEAAGWDVQGHPFYAEGVAYRQNFEVPQSSGQYFVELPDWYGSVAKVTVNGQKAGYIGYQPWECDVTERIQLGTNHVEVLIIGTLKNTLGPHHSGAVRGFASPHSFARAPATGPPPGGQYDTIGYGLFKPFVLKHRIK